MAIAGEYSEVIAVVNIEIESPAIMEAKVVTV